MAKEKKDTWIIVLIEAVAAAILAAATMALKAVVEVGKDAIKNTVKKK